MLDIGGGNAMYWETSGNPAGEPAIWLHGGPGSGLGRGGYRKLFDPDRYLIVGIDQRGCGRSRPLAIDARDSLGTNTTAALIDDIELLRGELGVERWLVSGGSWGSTLALAYALEHPDRVTALAIAAVTTTSRSEVDWITDGVGRIFPEAWADFEAASHRGAGERVVDAYARRLRGDDADDRTAAADAWDRWESTHVSLDPMWTPGPLHEDSAQRELFALLVTHYWANDGFLVGPRAIIERVHEIAHIPAILVHGRHDISGPAVTPWRLHRSWPASELVIIETEGHGGPESSERLSTWLSARLGAWLSDRLRNPVT